MVLKDHSFGVADHGVAWAAAQLPGGQVVDGRIRAKGAEVRLAALEGAKGEDDYAITFNAARPGEVTVAANTAVGAIGGLLRLGEILRSGKREDFASSLRFRTRNYKHEVRLVVAPKGPVDKNRTPEPRQGQLSKSITNYTDEVWEGLCRQIVAHQFNGLVLYCAYHPFEYVLDYSGFPQAASRPEEERTAVREALNRGLAIAHKYGLKTFMQHYIGHFTQQLADAYKIMTTGRLSAIDHPEIERYCRWCYREMFRQVPDLDGMYFNFESFPNAHEHILKTAIHEFNLMDRKPIIVFRLWGYADPEGMKKMMAAYQGRTMVSHKVSDTNDVYYLPVADSRATDWKKLVPELEWLYCVGPCHNCGTNLCDQLWGDYEYVQTLLADAQAKGADSIGFHTVNEFFSPDVKDASGVFSKHELEMARFNRMHLQAAADYFNGRSMTRAQRAEALAARVGAPSKAGAALLDVVESASQPVLLTYQQFCYGSNMDGYLNPGRWSLIQDPFYFYPACELNDQASRLMWQMERTNCPWIDKTTDTKVCPDGVLQHIIDYVDPSKPRTTRNPKKLADLIEANIAKSLKALVLYRRLAGTKAADALRPYVEANAAEGRFVRRQILAAIQLYSIYFARTKAGIVKAVKAGLAELEKAQAIVADTASPIYKTIKRVLMLDRLDMSPEINEARQLLALVEKTDFPMAAYREYLESRRQYNEIRRLVRPLRRVNDKVMAVVRQQMQAAIEKARASLAAMGDPQAVPERHYFHARDKAQAGPPKYEALGENVRAWLAFVENELARTTPPEATVTTQPSRWFSLQHDDCFREGFEFVEDFTAFFKPTNLLLPAGLSFQVWRTEKELAVRLREDGVSVAQRKARWEKFKYEGSNAYVMQVHLDVDDKGKRDDTYIVWPMGVSVSAGHRPNAQARTEFTCDAVSWEMTVYLPFELLGRAPAAGDVWRLNVTSNPAVTRNTAYTWAPQYDAGGNPLLYGRIRFG
ncbi:MAG: hypothetical protein ACE15C_13130 [Phycisphaerae bacterium]